MTDVCGDHGRKPGCGAPILWAKTTAGNAVPLDPDPVDGGNLELVGDWSAGRQSGVIASYVQAEPGVARYVSHFATCPNSKDHRAPKLPRRRAKPPAPPADTLFDT